MDQRQLDQLLNDLPLGATRYYPSVGSTNDLAMRWAQAGAPDLGLVVADEQQHGRGRGKRRWQTPPGSALAFSLILHPAERTELVRYTALGALAVCDTLNQALSPVTPAQIKWPNDVLAERRKLAGVLAEAQWHGNDLQAMILGIGINVAPESVPPPDQVDYPATCVQDVVQGAVDRWGLLHDVLATLITWLAQIGSPEFILAWESRLALRGERVRVLQENAPDREGVVLGLGPQGSLRLGTGPGQSELVNFGEIQIRPARQPD